MKARTILLTATEYRHLRRVLMTAEQRSSGSLRESSLVAEILAVTDWVNVPVIDITAVTDAADRGADDLSYQYDQAPQDYDDDDDIPAQVAEQQDATDALRGLVQRLRDRVVIKRSA